MDELTDGTIVWVKLSNCWWPGEVIGDERLSEDFLSSLRKKPLAVVKFFDEDAYEYVKNPNFIFKYNCPRKNEFLRKGMEQYRAKNNKHMEKFPSDVMHAERMTGGDPDIVNSTDFLSPKKERYSGLFQDTSKLAKGKLSKTPSLSSGQIRPMPGRRTIHEVRFLTQPSSSNGTACLPGISNLMEGAFTVPPTESPAATSAAITGSQLYHCHKCGFSSSRQNVIVIHMKNCRAVGSVPSSNFTPPRRPLQSTDSMLETSRRSVSLLSEIPKPTPDTPVATDSDRDEKQPEKLHEKLLEQETTPTNSRIRASRTPKVSVKKVTVDRRRGRRGHQAKKQPNTDSDDEKDDVPKESSIEPDQTETQANSRDRNRQPSTVEQVNAEKGKTDAKLKSELLADWSEDEQDDDTDEAERSSGKNVPKKEPIATSPPETQEGETRSDSEPNQKNQSPSDEEGGTAKVSDKETVSVEMSPSNASQTGSASSSTTALPLASPSGTTIKYRNIPKKQKREYIEVTNDDPSVQEKTKAVSREASSASLSMKVASTEALVGNGVATSTPVGERPISAKQLILNRATRGSSKSLSGDETALAAVTAAAKATAKLAVGDGKLAVDHDRDKVDAKGHSKQDNQQKSKDKLEHGKDKSSCFDFKDDDEGESQEATQAPSTVLPSGSLAETGSKEKSVTANQKKSGTRNERGHFANDDASQIHDDEQQQQQQQDSNAEETDRDAKLSKEIDFLLDETDVPKLPDDLDRAVSEKIDCNRALPPKERGKRIFKTRHSNATITAGDVKEDELTQSESSLRKQEQHHEEKSTTPVNEPQASSDASKKTASKLSAADRKWESAGTPNETRMKKVSHDEHEGEHFQNPSITSSKQVPDRETETTAKVKKAAKDTQSSVTTIEQQQLGALAAKGRRGKQKKPTPITIPVTPLNEDDADNNKTDVKEANLNENDPEPISGPREDEETVNTKTMRKSSENRLPDSSSISEHSRRRSKQKHHLHDEVVTPVDALEPLRRSSKRSRKDTAPTDDSKQVPDKHSNVESSLESTKASKMSDESAEVPAADEGTVPMEREKGAQAVDRQLKEEETSDRQTTRSVAEDCETGNKKVEKSSKDGGRFLKRKKDDTAQIVSSEKEEPVQNDALVEASDTSDATSPVLQEKKMKTATNSDENAPVIVVDSSTPVMAMASKRTPTDLQIAEALINLPEAATVSPKKHDPHDGSVSDNQKAAPAKDDDIEAGASSAATVSSASNCISSSPSAVVKGAAQSSSASSSSSKSINPRKRHLQTMMLVSAADASGKEEHIPPSGEMTSSSVTNITARYLSTEQQQKPPSSSSIPEKKKRESPETIATTMKEDDGSEEKFDISSMPIVMSDSDGLLVNEAVPKELNVNGGSGATKVKQHESPGTSSRKTTPIVASAKGGGSKVQEQIVITSKGTVLTTTSPVVAMTSKMSSATKASSVTVTSAITLGTPGSRMSSSISATTSPSSSSSSSSYILPRRVQQEQPESSSGGNGSTSSASSTNASTAMVPATPSSSSSPSTAAPKKVITKKLLSDTGSTMLSTSSSSSSSNNSTSGSDNTNLTVASSPVVVDRRYSGDSVTSSSSVGIAKSQQQQQQHQQNSNNSSSSSSSRLPSEHSGGKKRHRVIQLTPEKLEKFNRLGYIADKGNGKVLTVEGMRKIKQQKQLSQQQKQKLHQSSSVAKTTVAAVIATTSSSQSVRQAGEDLAEGKRKVKHSLAPTHTVSASRSSNSNAGTKTAVASSSNSSDGTNSTSSRPASEVATSGNVVVAAAADSSVQELQSAGTSGVVEPSSQQVVVTDADRNAVIVIDSKADPENVSPEPTETPDQMAETGTLQSFPPDTDSMMEGGGSPTSSTTSAVVGSEMILNVQPELMASPAALVEASSSSSNTGGGCGVAAATATIAAAPGAEQETHEYMAVPAESFGGPPSLFYLCSMREERLVPVDNQLLYLDASNQLVALTPGHQHDGSGTVVTGGHSAEDIINHAEVIIPAGATNAALASAGIVEVAGTAVEVAEEEDEAGAMSGEGGSGVVVETGSADGGTQQSFLINTQDGQQIILDQQSLMALAAGGDTPHLVTADGQQILLQDTAQEWLAALAVGQQPQTTVSPDSAGPGSGGTLSALVTAEGTQIILTQDHAGSLIELQEQASLLPADVLPVNHPSTTIETNAILTKPPIMSTVEVPSKNGNRDPNGNSSATFDLIHKQQTEASPSTGAAGAAVTGKEGGAPGVSIKLPTTPKPPSATTTTTMTPTATNLDETLAAVIGVPSKPNVPTSLELPITVTNPAIAKTTTTSSRINPVLFPIVPSIAGQPAVESTGTAIVLLAGGQLAATGTTTDGDTPSSFYSHPSSTPVPSPPSITPEQRDGDVVGETDATHHYHQGHQHQQEVVEDSALASTETAEAVAKHVEEEEEDEIQIPCTPDSQADDDNHGGEEDDEMADEEQHQHQHQDGTASDDEEGQRLGGRRWLGSRIAGRTNGGRRPGAPRRHPMMMMMMMVDDDNDDSNCSEIIPLQPNVVVLDAAALLAQQDHESDEEEDEPEKEHHREPMVGIQNEQEFANDDAPRNNHCGTRPSAVPNGIAPTADDGGIGIAEINQDNRGSHSTSASRRGAVER